MAVFTITTFSTFVGLLLAAKKLATDPDILNRAEALADLASNGKALAATLRDRGLTPLAAEMTKVAEKTARHFTHPGRARDDAIALFWQVAPAAFADPSVFAAADLDAATATDRMVAAIKASPHARDFTATGLPDSLFRQVAHRTLTVMLAKSEYIATITPDLWRETLRRHGIQVELLARLAATTDRTEGKVDELNARVAELTAQLAISSEAQIARESGVSEKALIRLVRPIAEDVDDIGQALIELTRAVEIAAKVQQEGRHGSNLGEFVDEVLRRTAALSAKGEHRAAISELDDALLREEAESQARTLRLLSRAIDEHLLARDPEGAAEKIVRRVILETPDPARLFVALRGEQHVWYERGRDNGLRLDLEISIILARQCHARASDMGQRGAALNVLAISLSILGERESGTARLEEAVAAYRAALEESTRDRAPLNWAGTQNNLGNALWMLGERESGTARLEEAVAAYRAALEEYTRDRAPLDWAMTQMNLGSALSTLGARESGTARLEEAVAAYRAALEEYTRDRVPLDWATTQNNLGNALQSLGTRESGTARLQEAVAAYRAALEERTRERVPLDWAGTQDNLRTALSTLGEHESGMARLEEAVAAYSAALEERTRDRVPLNWAMSIGNQGVALALLAERTSDIAMARHARDQIAAAEAAARNGGHAPLADYYAGELPVAEALVARLAKQS